jgi:site-specific recombinase XerC
MTPEPHDTTDPTPPAHAAARPRPASMQRPPAPETQRLYALDWKTFAAWCQAAGMTALPADPATVAAFLAAAGAGEKCGAGALGRRAAAIAHHHRAAGLASPSTDPAVTALLRAARRGATSRRKPTPRPALVRMAAGCPGDLAGVRDRALLLLAAAGLGRAALVGLDADHVRFAAGSVDLIWQRPGPDGATVQPVTVACGVTLATCPVQALRRWLDLSDTRFGPVFRKIDRWGTIEHRRLGTDALRRILARRRPRRVHSARTVAA